MSLQAMQEAKAASDIKRKYLLDQLEKLKQYATSLDSEAAPVKIRLEDARKAAEAVHVNEFRRLVQDILSSLDERYKQIVAAHDNLPIFVKAFGANTEDEAPSEADASEEESDDESGYSTESAVSSQLSH